VSNRCALWFTLGPVVLWLGAFSASAAASAGLQSLLHQIFVEHAFDGAPPPQIEWMDEGTHYTVAEKSADLPDAEDIVRYTTPSGKREVLVSARSLKPHDAVKPLKIEGYSFSKDKQRVLIFTNTKPVWRQHTRGDYWLFNLDTPVLEQLGGNGEPSTMQSLNSHRTGLPSRLSAGTICSSKTSQISRFGH
jgi:dipeptidyl-peptidase-4